MTLKNPASQTMTIIHIVAIPRNIEEFFIHWSSLLRRVLFLHVSCSSSFVFSKRKAGNADRLPNLHRTAEELQSRRNRYLVDHMTNLYPH